MKTKHKIIAFVGLFLLLISTNLLAGNFELKMNENSLTYFLVSFLVFDLILGFILVFGKVKWTRKKNRSFDYLKTYFL